MGSLRRETHLNSDVAPPPFAAVHPLLHVYIPRISKNGYKTRQMGRSRRNKFEVETLAFPSET
eukprot:3668814-Prorocentrum_lima.AAC.1